MPIKLGPLIIEGHRPDGVETKYPGAKERVEQQDMQGVPLPVRQGEPLLGTSRATPGTRHPSVEAVNMAIGRFPLLKLPRS